MTKRRTGRTSGFVKAADIARLRYAKAASHLHLVMDQLNTLSTQSPSQPKRLPRLGPSETDDLRGHAQIALEEAETLLSDVKQQGDKAFGSDNRSEEFFSSVLAPAARVLAAGAMVTLQVVRLLGADRLAVNLKTASGETQFVESAVRTLVEIERSIKSDEFCTQPPNGGRLSQRRLAYRATYNIACFWTTYAMFGLAETWTVPEDLLAEHEHRRPRSDNFVGKYRRGVPKTSEEAFDRAYQSLSESLRSAPLGEATLLAAWAPQDPSLSGLFSHPYFGPEAQKLVELVQAQTDSGRSGPREPAVSHRSWWRRLPRRPSRK